MIEDDRQRLLGSLEARTEGQPARDRAQLFGRSRCLFAPVIRQRHIDPAGEAVFTIPLRLSMPKKDKRAHAKNIPP